jgi:TRAP-type C4-dicarboxylate transport system permease small subunit
VASVDVRPAAARGHEAPAGSAVVRIARLVERAVDRLCRGLMLVAGIALLVVLNVVVVMRYVFETGLAFAPDLSELLFGILVLAGIVQAARLGVHVATQLLIDRLQGGWQVGLAVLIHATTGAVYALLAWYAVQNAIIAHDQTTPVLRIPWSGLALIALCSVTTMLRITLGREPVKVEHGATEVHAA